MNTDRIAQTVLSARITADAWDQVVGVFTTVECENHAGGQIYQTRGVWHPTGQPHRLIACVLPWSYPCHFGPNPFRE